jgi:hypothetical protein
MSELRFQPGFRCQSCKHVVNHDLGWHNDRVCPRCGGDLSECVVERLEHDAYGDGIGPIVEVLKFHRWRDER